MSLVKKTFLIIGLTLLILIGIIYAVSSYILSDGFAKLELRETRLNVERVLDAFLDDIAKVNLTAKDWSNWDDTYAYINDSNEQYARANLSANSLSIIKMNIVMYLNASEQTAFATGINLEPVEKVPVPESFLKIVSSNKLLSNHSDIQSSVSGLVMLSEGPLLIASRPILTSGSQGPIRGTLIFARFYDSQQIEALSHRTHLSVAMLPCSDENLPPSFIKARSQISDENPIFIEQISSKLIAGYTVIKDVFGKPALILRVNIPRDIYHQGQESIRYLFFSLLILGVVSLAVILVLLMKLVLIRIARLDSEVSKISFNKDVLARVSPEGNDEIARLAAAINEMLGQIEKSYRRLKLGEEHLRQTQKMDAVGRLAGGIAHDFNNLLTAIIGYSDLLLKSIPADSPLRKDLMEIKEAGDRAASLTRQLLVFGRKQIFQPQVMNLNPIVSGMDKMLQRLLGEGVEMIHILDKDLGDVKIDPSQIEQVIVNLAFNARDAMPSGGKLIIETSNVNLDEAYSQKKTEIRPGPYVMLAVSDSGEGMDKEVLAHLFEPFFTTKKQGEGIGLGLSVVYGIVKQMEGHICVYSEPGLGTTFKIYFPRVEQDASAAQAEKLPVKALRGKNTILLVEDEEIVRRLACEILRREGYTVLEASNGGEALLVSEQHRGVINLLLTDVVMPKMSGPELSERLEPKRPDMKVVFMSGYSDPNILTAGHLKQKPAFVQKPFTPQILIRKLREVLDQICE